jgi:PIN domain nuclease of toxin-antitoxin system
MKCLLDTHAVLWFLKGDPRLSAAARAAICGAGNERYVSAASVWEVAIKMNLGKFTFDGGFPAFASLVCETGSGLSPSRALI